jgi:type I restriction enzyme S subunit
MKLKPYPKYKPSGVEWLGDVPEQWEVKKLGYGVYLQGGFAFASEKFDSEGVPVVRMNNLKRGVLDTSEASCIAPEHCLAGFALAEGDLLWGMSGSIGDTGSLGNFARVHARDLPAQLNQRVGRFRVIGESVLLSFVTYVIQTRFFYDQILLRVTGTAQFNVSSQQVHSVKVPFPPVATQTLIAAFLDRETGRIDRLVVKKRELIERLKEKRTALISRTLTRGLPHAAGRSEKRSGVEWLGDVPAHWDVKKITYGFRKIGSGTTPKSDVPEYYDGDVPWVTTSELRETVITDTRQKVTKQALADYSTLRLYPAGTILFAMYGATIGRLGILGIPATVNQACCAMAWPTLFDPRFIYYWLWMRRPILISLSSGGGQPNLSQDELREIRIPTPPVTEQAEIVAFLDQETAKLDALVLKVEGAVERLQEYRTAIITAAVTGKIDVRKEVTP